MKLDTNTYGLFLEMNIYIYMNLNFFPIYP